MEMNKLTGNGDDEDEPRNNHKEERRERRHEREDREERPAREHKDRELRDRKKDRFNNDAAEKYRKKDEESDDEVQEEQPKERELRRGRPPKEEQPAEEPASEPAEEAPAEKKTPGRKKKDAARQTKSLSPEQQVYRDMLLDMASTHNAKVLNSDGEVIREVAVKGLVDSLRENSDGVATIVFDGAISQRILDVSTEKGISTVVGTRKGNITKMPAGIAIWTKEDLY